MGLTDWAFFADAARVSGSTLTNLGTAGTDLDATIGGDVDVVTGPTTGTLLGSGGAQSSINLAAGVSVLRNPDQTDTANKITTGDDAVLDIAADESAVLMWVGVLGNDTGGFPRAVTVGGNGASSVAFVRNPGSTPAGDIYARANDGTTTYSAGLDNQFSTSALDAWFIIIDRVADLMRYVRVQPDGTTTELTVSIASMSAITFAEGITSLLSMPGAAQFIAYDVARLVTVAEATAIAASLRTGTTLATSGTATCTPRANAATSTARANTIEVPA